MHHFRTYIGAVSEADLLADGDQGAVTAVSHEKAARGGRRALARLGAGYKE